MISVEKLTQVAADLFRKTRSQQVRWLPDIGAEDGYVVYLPHSRMRVSLNPEDGRIVFLLQNDGDHTVGELTVQPGEATYRLMKDLHSAAADASTRWDDVLREVESFVQSK